MKKLKITGRIALTFCTFFLFTGYGSESSGSGSTLVPSQSQQETSLDGIGTESVMSDDPALFYALVTLDESAGSPPNAAFPQPPATLISAEFFELPPTSPLASFSFAPDTCLVTTEPSRSPLADRSGRSVSAGEAIVISSPAGTWATVPEEQTGIYGGDRPESIIRGASAPSGLSLSTTGGEFPLLNDIPLADAPGRFDSRSNGDFGFNGGVTSNSVFTWNPIGGADAGVIYLEIAGQTEGNNREVTCIATNDGEFSFPASTMEALGASFKGRTLFANLERVAVFRDGSTLVVSIHFLTAN